MKNTIKSESIGVTKDESTPNNQVQNDKVRKFAGRSMVEMLGVLAIIGVLSIGGLAGFKIAMSYYRANETIHDVMLRAVNVQTRANYRNFTGSEFSFSDMGAYKTKNTLGYEVHAYPESATSDYSFRIEVSDVPSEVCKRINNMNPTAVDKIEPTAIGCGEETQKMIFYFDENFSISPPTGSSGSSSSSGGGSSSSSSSSSGGK